MSVLQKKKKKLFEWVFFLISNHVTFVVCLLSQISLDKWCRCRPKPVVSSMGVWGGVCPLGRIGPHHSLLNGKGAKKGQRAEKFTFRQSGKSPEGLASI